MQGNRAEARCKVHQVPAEELVPPVEVPVLPPYGWKLISVQNFCQEGVILRRNVSIFLNLRFLKK